MATGLTSTGVLLPDATTQSTLYGSAQDQGALISITTYASAGTFTWTKPSNCTVVLVRLVGGGGGAAGYCESGGAGGYTEKVVDVSAVSTVSVTVGGGGASVGYYTTGADGGTSSFGTYCSATGGYGANRITSHSGGTGGVGSGGDVNLYGGSGTGHANSSGHAPIGLGGSSYFGTSGAINRATTSNKLYNGAPGAGGPGARTNDGSGGAGIANGEVGLVIIEAYT